MSLSAYSLMVLSPLKMMMLDGLNIDTISKIYTFIWLQCSDKTQM